MEKKSDRPHKGHMKVCKKFIIVGLFFAMAVSLDAQATAPTNIIVDFDESSFDSTLRPGDSGIMNLVVKNTGGYRAEGVEVHMPSTGTLNIDKRFFIGRLEAGASRSLPVVVRVRQSSQTGLSAVNVRIDYDGFRQDGTRHNNMQTTWDIPIRIVSNPIFQIKPEKVSFYNDNIESMGFSGTLMYPVKDLEATLSSSCFTVMGSSRLYLGNLQAKERFGMQYLIKPTSEGACTANLRLEYLDESGSPAFSNMTFGINIESSGVDIRVMDISHGPTGPGETVTVKVELKNFGRAAADDASATLKLYGPFVPIKTSEKHLGAIGPGQTAVCEFELALTWEAQLQAYSIPMTIEYKIGGSSYIIERDLGVDITGSVVLEVINVEQKSGTVRVDVANMGTRTAESVKATLMTQAGNRTAAVAQNQAQARTDRAQRASQNPVSMITGAMTTNNARNTESSIQMPIAFEAQQLVDYKPDIKATRQTTFTFSTQATGPMTMLIEYAGPNNERVTQTERFTVGSEAGTTAFTRTKAQTTSSGYADYLNYAALAFAIYVGYRLYKKRRSNQGGTVI